MLGFDCYSNQKSDSVTMLFFDTDQNIQYIIPISILCINIYIYIWLMDVDNIACWLNDSSIHDTFLIFGKRLLQADDRLTGYFVEYMAWTDPSKAVFLQVNANQKGFDSESKDIRIASGLIQTDPAVSTSQVLHVATATWEPCRWCWQRWHWPSRCLSAGITIIPCLDSL